jgi:hypothetical protein
LYSPELLRLIDVTGRLMPRTFDDPTSSPCALHIFVSQHISTLPNTSGMHILGGEHAQVKHPLRMPPFSPQSRASMQGVLNMQLMLKLFACKDSFVYLSHE